MELLIHTPSSMNSIEMRVWQCNAHVPVLYRMTTTDPYIYNDLGVIIVPLKDKWYSIVLNLLDESKYAIEELEQQINSPNNFSFKQVVTMVPSTWRITADNATEKLQTLLVFM